MEANLSRIALDSQTGNEDDAEKLACVMMLSS